MSQPVPVRKVPPVPAGLAAVCALLGALPVAVFSLIAGTFAAASGVWAGLLFGAVPAAVALTVLVGVVARLVLALQLRAQLGVPGPLGTAPALQALDQLAARAGDLLVHVRHERHGEQRRREIDDRDRHEHRDE